MHRYTVLSLTLTGLLAGCGTNADPTASPTGPAPAAKTAAHTSAAVALSLNAGWNPVGFQYSQLSAVTPGPAVGSAFWDGTAYQTGSLTAAELNAGAGPFRGFYVFATGAGSLSYDGDNTRANSLTLRSGWNLVAFPALAPFSASNLRGTVGGQSVGLNTVLLGTAYECQGDLQNKPVDLFAASTLLGNGRPYWVFSSQNNVTLTYGGAPAASPSASPTVSPDATNTEDPPQRPVSSPKPFTFQPPPPQIIEDGINAPSASPLPQPLISPTPFPEPPESEAEPELATEEEGVSRRVYGSDTRKNKNASAAKLLDPYAQQCKLYCTTRRGNLNYIGSGTLIGRRHVLTSGHVLYDHDRGGFMSSVTVVPCQYTDSSGAIISPWGQFSGRVFISRTEFTSDKNPDYDLGIVVTDADSDGNYPGDYAGWMGFAIRSLDGKTGHQSSYPGDLANGDRQYYSYGLLKTGIFDLWKGQFGYPSDKRVVYDFDTAGGSSGAGLWVNESGKRYVVAVHQGGDPNYNYWNTANAITREIFDWIKQQKSENK